MNRLEYINPSLHSNEQIIHVEKNVRLYDGDKKTNFEGGEVTITSHRVFWAQPGRFASGDLCLALPIALITDVQEVGSTAFSFSRSSKHVALTLLEPSPDRNEGVQLHSHYNYIKLSFRDGLRSDVAGIIRQCMQNKRWLVESTVSVLPGASGASSPPRSQPQIKLRSGIVGIERNLLERNKAADDSISAAFQDLNKLMSMAKDMVTLSKNISNKIRDKQGDISEDETVQFKTYLMSLGIDDPVTRDDYKSDTAYYKGLATQISESLGECIDREGGMMTLTDVYCRVNRARGLELVSPEDFLKACRLMEKLNLPHKLHQFDTGVKVLQAVNISGVNVADATTDLVEKQRSLSATELAQLLGISVILAKERLLISENLGKLCRDDTMIGLRFYPNLFLSRD